MTDEMRTIIRESAARITETCGGEELFHARGCALPERAEVVDITEKLRALLFPGFFGDVSTARSEYAAGYALTGVCARLRVQLEAAFCYAGNGEIDVEEKAESVLKVFISSLPEVQKLLLCDVEAAFDGDPAAKSRAGVVFSYPGLHAITVYRLAHILYKEEVPFIPRIMTEYAHSLTGIDINGRPISAAMPRTMEKGQVIPFLLPRDTQIQEIVVHTTDGDQKMTPKDQI